MQRKGGRRRRRRPGRTAGGGSRRRSRMVTAATAGMDPSVRARVALGGSGSILQFVGLIFVLQQGFRL